MDARRKSPARAPQARSRDRSALPCTVTAGRARAEYGARVPHRRIPAHVEIREARDDADGEHGVGDEARRQEAREVGESGRVRDHGPETRTFRPGDARSRRTGGAGTRPAPGPPPAPGRAPGRDPVNHRLEVLERRSLRAIVGPDRNRGRLRSADPEHAAAVVRTLREHVWHEQPERTERQNRCVQDATHLSSLPSRPPGAVELPVSVREAGCGAAWIRLTSG